MQEADILKLTEPYGLFEQWMSEAKANSDVREATAMSLATVSAEGTPQVRVVLCKSWGPEGFTFFTNYDSQKGRDLAKHPTVACDFYWDAMFRQIKIVGTVAKTSRAESEAYWKTRPRDSQLSQFISKQSEIAASRAQLETLWQQADEQFKNKEIPCPLNWGGYRITPKTIEFWFGRKSRLHDRFLFEKVQSNWTIARLFP